MANAQTIAHATGTLTFTGQPLNTETVVVGGKTYTFQSSLTNVDGNVAIGADAATSIDNLYAAINLGSGAGTAYAAAMTANTRVKATSETATTLVVKALTAGEVGNLIASTETLTNGSWGAATLASGSGNTDAFVTSLLNLNNINAEVMFELKKLTVDAD